jgi:hypothetical protein
MKKNPAYRARRRRQEAIVRVLKWTASLAVIGLILFGLSRMSGVAYDEDDIAVVSFSGLTDGEKRTALESANRAPCTCGCGMTLARCVSTDMTCPVRDKNIQTIRTMVVDADQAEP